MRNKIMGKNVRVPSGKSRRDTAVLLLAAAEKLGVDPTTVRTTYNGFLAPEEVVKEAGVETEKVEGQTAKKTAAASPVGVSGDDAFDRGVADTEARVAAKTAEPAPAKKAAAKKTTAKKTAAKKTTAKKTAAKKSTGSES